MKKLVVHKFDLNNLDDGLVEVRLSTKAEKMRCQAHTYLSKYTKTICDLYKELEKDNLNFDDEIAELASHSDPFSIFIGDNFQ